MIEVVNLTQHFFIRKSGKESKMAAKKILMITGDFVEDYEAMVPRCSLRPECSKGRVALLIRLSDLM